MPFSATSMRMNTGVELFPLYCCRALGVNICTFLFIFPLFGQECTAIRRIKLFFHNINCILVFCRAFKCEFPYILQEIVSILHFFCHFDVKMSLKSVVWLCM